MSFVCVRREVKFTIPAVTYHSAPAVFLKTQRYRRAAPNRYCTGPARKRAVISDRSTSPTPPTPPSPNPSPLATGRRRTDDRNQKCTRDREENRVGALSAGDEIRTFIKDNTADTAGAEQPRHTRPHATQTEGLRGQSPDQEGGENGTEPSTTHTCGRDAVRIITGFGVPHLSSPDKAPTVRRRREGRRVRA